MSVISGRDKADLSEFRDGLEDFYEYQLIIDIVVTSIRCLASRLHRDGRDGYLMSLLTSEREIWNSMSPSRRMKLHFPSKKRKNGRIR